MSDQMIRSDDKIVWKAREVFTRWQKIHHHQHHYQRLKVSTFIYRHLGVNPNSSGLQCEVEYWPALAVGGAAQLATTDSQNERTLDPQ